jgi:glucokinase
VQIGTGIGAGIFVNGRMLRGATLAGGELGHMVIDRNGPLCLCGKKGCVEAYASIPATISRVMKAMDRGAVSSLGAKLAAGGELTAQDIVTAARGGDETAQSALAETALALAIAIANAAQLLNPSLIVLAGKFATAARDDFIEAISQAVRAQCFETISRGLEIRAAPFRKDLVPVGCALLAAIDVASELLQRLIFPPLVAAAGSTSSGDLRQRYA